MKIVAAVAVAITFQAAHVKHGAGNALSAGHATIRFCQEPHCQRYIQSGFASFA